MLSLLIGVPLGVLSSLGAWWLLFHVFVPKIIFSSFISKISEPDQEPRVRYRVKLKNIRRRVIVDLTVIAELRVKGINPHFPKNLTVVRIPLRGAHLSTLGPKQDRIVTLLPGVIPAVELGLLPLAIREKGAAARLTLEELLVLGSEAQLRIVVFAYDGFSGSRKAFISQNYSAGDIKPNRFKGMELGDEEPSAAGVFTLGESQPNDIIVAPLEPEQSTLGREERGKDAENLRWE